MATKMLQATVLAALCSLTGAVTLTDNIEEPSVLAEVESTAEGKKCDQGHCAAGLVKNLWPRVKMGAKIHANVDVLAP